MLVGPNGAGQDQPGRGAGLRRDARLAPGRDRRAAGAGGRGARGRPGRGRRRDGRELLVELEINPGKANRARLNRSPVPRPREVLGALRTVLFAPEDLALVRGDPGERRRFLDELLVAAHAALRRRAGRLRPGAQAAQRAAEDAPGARAAPVAGADLRTLDVWDGHLARFGAELLAGRLGLVRDLAPHVADRVRRGRPAAAGRPR